MNAKELAESLKQASQRYSVRDLEVMAILYGSSLEVSKLVPAYRPPQPSDDGKWCFIEELPSDAPPTLVRSYKPLRFDADTCSYEVDMNSPYKWQYWTVAGWRELTQGVWPCERPEGGGT